MTRLFAAVAALTLIGPAAAVDPPPEFLFRKGDRVLFLGDSITEQYQYSTYLELYLTTRFPDGNMFFLNAGIGGDTATGGAGRFARHVLAEKPTVITINFGMNDGGYGGFVPERHAAYVKNTEAMLAAAKQAGVRVGLVSPNAVEVRSAARLKTYLETQQQFYAPLKELAAKYEVPFVDQYAVTRKVLEKLAEDMATVKTFSDGVHTDPAGGLLMAHTILTGFKAPAQVSNLEFDAKNPAESAKAQGCKASDFATANGGVKFKRLDDALPMPVQDAWQPLLKYVNDLKDLNYMGLKVAGLADGDYTLRIDGKDVASYTAKELAAGVNIGNLEGPLFDQGNKVFAAIREKNQIVHRRFRQVMMAQIPDWLADVGEPRRAEELKQRLEGIEKLQGEVYKLVQPKEHEYELIPTK